MAQVAEIGIEKYQIARELGRGATSIVYLAHDTFNDREVAIKVFKPEILSDPEHGNTYRKRRWPAASTTRTSSASTTRRWAATKAISSWNTCRAKRWKNTAMSSTCCPWTR